MALDLGSGTPLNEFSPWLRNEADRHARILRVVECNSVIEGLPAFSAGTRSKIAAELIAIAAAQQPEPTGSRAASADSSG